MYATNIILAIHDITNTIRVAIIEIGKKLKINSNTMEPP